MRRGSGTRGRNRKQAQVQLPSPRSSWGFLPLELREMILEFLEDSLQAGEAAAYASVSKEWYVYFERYIFRRIKLSLKRLEELEAIVNGHRQPFVQHIWFRFEKSIQLGVTPVKFRHQLDHYRFATAILQLFQILSEWTGRDAGQPGIVLELTAFSAADPDHSMKDTVPEELKDVDLTVESEALNAVYDKTPGEMRRFTDDDKRRQTEVKECYVPQDFGAVPATPYPKVKLITDLTVRRQMHSSFFSAYMKNMIQALPSLEFLTYEPSCISGYWGRTRANASVVKDIITAMPSSIRRLQMFKDDPALYNAERAHVWDSHDRGSLGRLIADLSQDKEPEALAMSFIIDAVHFFSDFWTPQISRPHYKLGWLNLTSLVLTSSVITPHSSDKITPLLLAAARAARHMPKLEVMEVYYAQTKHGGIFTYIHDNEGSVICWESTWKWKFPPEVISAWKRAADVRSAKAFDYHRNLIMREKLRWPGSILSLLSYSCDGCPSIDVRQYDEWLEFYVEKR
ncbi:hypothetical protein V8C37DRAFT_395764 [Trichoderma ceciliae]